jgi:hypothetical protein
MAGMIGMIFVDVLIYQMRHISSLYTAAVT